MKAFVYLALIASVQSVKLVNHSENKITNKTMIESKGMHACDYIDDNGEEISTSLMPEYVQIESETKHACDYIDDNGEEISTSLMPEYVQLQDEEPAEEAAPSEEAAA